ncbi:unnamed protein product, partial [Rotaria sp. Silwood1]
YNNNNNILININDESNRRYIGKTSENIRRLLRWFGWKAEPLVQSLPQPPPPPTTTIQKIKRFFLMPPSIE